MNYVLSQVFAMISELCLLSSCYMKEKLKQLIFLLVSCGLMLTHYFLLGALTGGVLTSIYTLTFIVAFLLNRKGEKISNIYIAIAFIALYITFGILTYSNWFCIMPIIAYSFSTLFQSFNNDSLMSLGYFIQACALGCYTFCIESYTAFGLKIAFAICCVVLFFINLKKEKNNNRSSDDNNNIQ